MIYQAKVTFHVRQALVKIPGEGEVPLEIEQSLLVSPRNGHVLFISPPQTAICRIYLAPCNFTQISPTVCKLTRQITKERAKSDQTQSISLVTIKSSQQCISEIKVQCPARKYKSCLSFSPSEVRHISILSGQSTTQKFRGFINLIVIMFLVLNIRNIYDNFVNYGIRFVSYPQEFLPLAAVIGFFFLFAFIELAYRLDKLRFHRILSDRLVRILVKVNQAGILYFLYIYCRKYLTARPISGIALTSFGIVFVLKLISYTQVNTEILTLLNRSSALARSEFSQYVFANHEISQQNLKIILQNRRDWQPLLSRKKLYYFLIAPTLCYQLQYPRSPPIRYPWLIKRIIQFIIISALHLVLWVQYIQPELHIWFSKGEGSEFSWHQIIYRLLRLSIPNTIGWIMGFYSFFHLFLNIISEIIRFGDRNFYQDWWNCKNLEQYWKTWNLPVHFFFIRHCYTPLLKRGWSKLAANLLVFLISAIAHQYLVDVPLGITSYYAFLAMLMNAPVMIIQKKLSKMLKLQDSELGNVSFWLFFCFVGQPTCLFIYYSLYMKTHMT